MNRLCAPAFFCFQYYFCFTELGDCGRIKSINQDFAPENGPTNVWKERVSMNSSKTSVSVLTTSALLIALGVVLSLFRIPLSTVTEITLTGLPIAAGGYLFGPWIGMLIGALIDICGFFVAPKGPFFPGFTISTALLGMVYGLLLYRKWWDNKTCRMSLFHAGAKGLALRVAFSHLLKTVFISLLLNCFWLSVFYGMTFKVVFLASIPKEAINYPIEVFLIYSVVQILNRIRPL